MTLEVLSIQVDSQRPDLSDMGVVKIYRKDPGDATYTFEDGLTGSVAPDAPTINGMSFEVGPVSR